MIRFVVIEVYRDGRITGTKVVNTAEIKHVSREYIESRKEDRYTVYLGDGKHPWGEYLLPPRIKTDQQAIAYLSWAPQGGN